MRRLPVLIVSLLLSGVALHARTADESGKIHESAAAAKSRPRRVLFRTDSPRLFATPAVKPTPRTPAPTVRREPPQTAKPPAPTTNAARSTPARSSVAKATVLEPGQKPVSAPAPRAFEIEFHSTTFTPYDPYLGAVRSVISRLDQRRASMLTACDLVREGRLFRYVATDPYRAQPPRETEARRAGDCKSKALWLYDHLGDPGAFYVIGKLERRSRSSHAWVYWRYGGRWWILDPTDRATPIAADSVASGRYVPYYSYSRAGAFRHQATRLLLAKNGIPAVPAVAVNGRQR